MDERNRIPWAPIALVLLILVSCVGLALFVLLPNVITRVVGDEGSSITMVDTQFTQQVIPTFTSQPQIDQDASYSETGTFQGDIQLIPSSFETLYEQVSPGVVNIQVYTQTNGTIQQGAGSGFILDDQGHIVTNNHVIADASLVSVIYFNGVESRAEVVGADEDSDLAVVKVEELIPEVHPLPLGDSNNLKVGEWVIAIGNPFGNQNSLSSGIVSALGRTIPTGTTPFSIPQSIQTDAAINPGNSGGPLINLNGEVIGVNAQIATNGERANSGVGFAIPVNILRQVVPALIGQGSYEWPWLGVEGSDVSLSIVEANGLEVQQGAYINGVVSGGPADQAGIMGSSSTREVDGLISPVGGDVVVEVDGTAINSFDDLLVAVAFKKPGDNIDMVILRQGERMEFTVELEGRP